MSLLQFKEEGDNGAIVVDPGIINQLRKMLRSESDYTKPFRLEVPPAPAMIGAEAEGGLMKHLRDWGVTDHDGSLDSAAFIAAFERSIITDQGMINSYGNLHAAMETAMSGDGIDTGHAGWAKVEEW